MADSKRQSSYLTRVKKRLDLDLPTVMLMFKASLAPTIAIAFFQADAVAETYTTLGYLVAIMSLLGFAFLPRAKFIQNMLFNLIAVSIAAAVALLVFYCSVKAREHTTPPGQATVGPTAGYNSSASAVCGIWLFFQIFFINAFKSYRPQFTIQTIIYAIFCIVSITYAPQGNFGNMVAAQAFVASLLRAFTTGFALATGVSLFVFPITCRKPIFAQYGAYLAAIKNIGQSQVAYMACVEDHSPFVLQPHDAEDEFNVQQARRQQKRRRFWRRRDSTAPVPQSEMKKAADKLRGSVAAILGLHGKVKGDLPFAKREVAWGKLGPDELQEIFVRFESITLPMVGITSVLDIFERIAYMTGWDGSSEVADRQLQAEVTKEWQDIMKALRPAFEDITNAISEAVDHAGLLLELKKPASGSTADEEGAHGARPGSTGFAAWFEDKIRAFYKDREVTLKQWCLDRGLSHLPEQSSTEKGSFWSDSDFDINGVSADARHRRQLFMMLHMEQTVFVASRKVLDLVKYADSKREDGTMSKSRLVHPGRSRLWKWLKSSVLSQDGGSSDDNFLKESGTDEQTIQLGSAFGARPDPEHLPPVNTWERFGNRVRQLPHILRSKHSVFGMRAAVATMTIGVTAFLEASQSFFVQQRVLWALIMISFSMTQTSGQSLFNFAIRIVGTFIAMVASYVVWYIVDAKTPGVIVFTWLWVFCSFWVMFKIPRYTPGGIIAGITVILIVGYELQVQKIGVAVAESNGQEAYPLYLLAPYRLLTVCGGLSVAYFWTIFPYPINETSELRLSLGAAIYLVANYYSVVHESMRMYIRGEEGDPNDAQSPSRQLAKPRQKVFVKAHVLLTQIKAASSFTHWQLQMGGKFPRQTYSEIIKLTSRILDYSALVSYASRSFAETPDADGLTATRGKTNERSWKRDFRVMNRSIGATSHDNTSALTMLASAVYDGRPLAPYVKMPEPFRLYKKLASIDGDILDVRHIAEPGFAAFAVMQIASRSIAHDINALAAEVKKLVGEMDFSYHIVRSSDRASDSESDMLSNSSEADLKKV